MTKINQSKWYYIAAGVFVFFVLFVWKGVPIVIDLVKQATAKKVVSLWSTLANVYGAENVIDPVVILTIICKESGGNPDAVNPSDPSRGLMAITQGALADYNRANGTQYTFDDLFDPDTNVAVGSWYIATRLQKTKNLHDAFAAYNGGLGGINVPDAQKYANDADVYLTHVQAVYSV